MHTDAHGYGLLQGTEFSPGRCWVLVVLLAATAAADVEELIRRADVRFAHGNDEGAILLLEEALREDPSCAAAMERMADHGYFRSVDFLLRYLRDARPLDRERVEGLMPLLGPFDLPDEAWRRVERDALLPVDAWDEAAGPFLLPAIPDRLPPRLPAAGPLRSEVFVSPAHRHQEKLAEIARRWEEDGIADPYLWSTLAVMYHRVGDETASERALSMALPESIEDRLACATIYWGDESDARNQWREVFEPILDDIESGRLRPDDRWPWPWFWLRCSGAARGLRETSTVVRTAKLRARTARPGLSADGLPSDLAWAWEGATVYGLFQTLKDDADPIAACLRALLLDAMLQSDRASAELDQAIAAAPDDWLPHAVLLKLGGQPAGAARRRSARVVLRAALAAWEAGVAPDLAGLLDLAERTGDDAERTEITRRLLGGSPTPERVQVVLSHWEGDRVRGAPVDLLARAVASLPKYAVVDLGYEQQDPRQVLARIAVRERRADVFLDACEGLTPQRAPAIGMWLRERLLGKPDFGFLMDLLRRFAAEASPSRSCDAAMRAFFLNGPDDVPHSFCRAREVLAADAAYMELPGASYVLSLLLDPAFQREEAAAARKAAYVAGCRAPGLLRDLAEAGEDVLADLDRVDCPAGLLLRALRSEGTDALLAFLAEDEAMPSDLRRAREELVRRGGQPPTPPSPIAPAWEEINRLETSGGAWASAGEVARLLCVFTERPNRGCLSRWHSMARFLSRGLESALAEAWPKRPSPPGQSLAERVQALATEYPSSRDEAWRREVLEVLRAGRQEALGKLLRGPLGTLIAIELAYVSALEGLRLDLVAEVRKVAAEQPLDLRWLTLEPGLPSGPTPPRSAAEVRLLVDAAALRTPAGAMAVIDSAEGEEARKAAVARFLDLTREDTASEVLRWTRWDCKDEMLTSALVEALAARAGSERDKAAFSDAAQHWGHSVVSSALDRDLLSSADPGLRLGALERCIKRAPAEFDANGQLALAIPGGRTDQERRALWLHLAQCAVERRDEGELRAALERMWDHALYEVLDDAWFRDRVRAWISDKDAPTCAWLLACEVDSTPGGAPIESKPLGELARRGVLPRKWFRSGQSLGAGMASTALDQILETIPRGDPAYEAQFLVRDLIRRLDSEGHRDEAAACADAWASRVGSVRPPTKAREWTWLVAWHPASGYDQPGTPCVEDDPWPEGLHAAWMLSEIGLSDLALTRLETALEGAPLSLVDPCRLRGAQLRVAAGRPAEAVHALIRLAKGSRWSGIQRLAHVELSRLAAVPEARPGFMQALVEQAEGLPDPSPGIVEGWERRLGAEDSSVRQAASDELEGMGGTALPLLLALRRSPDIEVRARAEALLADLATWK